MSDAVAGRYRSRTMRAVFPGMAIWLPKAIFA
jgi:hypothetical protein